MFLSWITQYSTVNWFSFLIRCMLCNFGQLKHRLIDTSAKCTEPVNNNLIPTLIRPGLLKIGFLYCARFNSDFHYFAWFIWFLFSIETKKNFVSKINSFIEFMDLKCKNRTRVFHISQFRVVKTWKSTCSKKISRQEKCRNSKTKFNYTVNCTY